MEQSHQKTFSLEEANRIVPFLSSAFTEIFALNQSARSLDMDINDLVEIWGEEVTMQGPVDHEIYRERMERRKDMHKRGHEIFDTIFQTGAVIKDTDTGLVDFYSKQGDDLIMLCWKFGEDRIKFWHPVSTGFSKRKPVDELRKR